MVEIISYQNALAASASGNRFLLLGNGFSIAWDHTIFSYGSLKEKASTLGEDIRRVFEKLDTVDFEEVIRAYEYAASVCESYEIDTDFKEKAVTVRDTLIDTIAISHPELPSKISETQFEACVDFLGSFKSIYTLNYDMLLYWVLMRDMFRETGRPKLRSLSDGFAYNDEEFLNWDGSSFDIYYMHGALHLFEESDLLKLNYSENQTPLKEQFIELIKNRKKFPLFVAEGSSAEKESRIRSSGYLTRCLNSLQKIGRTNTPDSLFTFGVSFSDNDEHISKYISHNKIQKLFVGVYGDPESEENKKLIQNVSKIVRLREGRGRRAVPLSVQYYNAEDANVWGEGQR